jgi:hypothetical protein
VSAGVHIQIAHLEKLRTDRLNWAAAVFQKNWKRILAERRFRAMRTAAVKIQTRTSRRWLRRVNVSFNPHVHVWWCAW